MRNVLLAVLLTACGGEEVPSCQDAITSFYGVGCTFVNLQTNQPYSLNESIVSCKDVNSVVPDRCRSKFDDYMFCLDGVATMSQCTDCTGEQDALFGCQ